METTVKSRNMTAIYLLKGDKILMLYRQGSTVANDRWIGAAGGHFEECELNDPKACVLRELKEELYVTEDMIENLQLRYITLRRAQREIRQNYYFFANIKEGIDTNFSSNEGVLRWFEYEEVLGLEMPFSAKYMMEHFLKIGKKNNKIYAGAADGEKVVFTELPAF